MPDRPPDPLDAMQSILAGRAIEEVTGRVLSGLDLRLSLRSDGATVPLPTTLLLKPGGWYALALVPARHLPAIAGQADLVVEAWHDGGRVMPLETLFPAPPVSDVSHEAEAKTYTLRIMTADPIRHDIKVPPPPVAIVGTVLRGHDPEAPVGGATVTVMPDGEPKTTNSRGGFRIPAPLAKRATLTATAGDDTVESSLILDFSKRENRVTLSLPSISANQ